MPLTTTCLLVTAALGAGALFSRVFRRGLEARETLELLPHARLGEMKTGWVRVRGQVRAVEKPLIAPSSGRPAVYYEVDVSAKVMMDIPPLPPLVSGGRVRRRHIGAVAFEIDDGSGRARVRLPEQLIDDGLDGKPEILTALGAGKRFAFRGAAGAPPQLVHLLSDLNLVKFSILDFRPLSTVERIIAPGDEIILAGYATREVDPSGSSIGFRSPPTLIVFAATNQHALVLANGKGLESWWART